jgi:hypothetical protein
MDRADWEMQEQCERERWQMTVDALDACRVGTATEAQIEFIARELGISNNRGEKPCRKLER